jgi:hypothetical protein
MKANSNFNFSKSSRFSSDIALFLLAAKAAWALRCAKLTECPDAMNFDWFKPHPLHLIATIAAQQPFLIFSSIEFAMICRCPFQLGGFIRFVFQSADPAVPRPGR